MRLSLVSQCLLVFISVLSLTRAQTTSPLTTSAPTTETATTTSEPTAAAAESTTMVTTSVTAETTTTAATTGITSPPAPTTLSETAPTMSEPTTAAAESTKMATTVTAAETTMTAPPTAATTETAPTMSEPTTAAAESTKMATTVTAETTMTAPPTAATTGITPPPAPTTLSGTTTSSTTISTKTAPTMSEPTTAAAESTTMATTSVTAETTTTAATTGITSPPAPTTLSGTTTSTTTISTTTTTTTPWTAPSIFYPFGAAAGDTEFLENGGDTYQLVDFSAPFTYFGRKYNNTYINNNGLLTFNQPLPEAQPYAFPTHGAEDYIAALWTELDDVGIGRYSYQEYTNGSVLTRATQDINQYFPGRGFTASWVFVATWDYVLTWDWNVFTQHSGPAITVQAVLISGGGFSFILMHYGDCAGEIFPVEAGYDTIGSTDYYVIHYDSNNGYSIPNLKTTTNVDVPGRWAFLVNNGTEITIGVQMKLQSFLDLTQSGNMEVVLHQIKQELVSHGVSSNFELKLRKVKKS